MKRMFFLIPLLVLTVSFAGAITIWFSGQGKSQFKSIVDEFNVQNPHELINLVFISNIRQKLQQTLNDHGTLPDAALVGSGEIDTLASLKRIAPVAMVNTTNFFKKAFTYKNHMYAYPYYANVQLVYVNADVYRGSLPGNDWTISTLEKMISNVKESNHEGIGFDESSPYLFTSFNAAFNDGRMPQKNGVPLVDTKGTMKAFKFYNMLFNEKKYAVSYPTKTLIKVFEGGKVAFIFQSSSWFPRFLKDKVNFRVLPYPRLSNDQQIPPILDAKGFVVFKKSSVVRKFLDYVTSAEQEIRFCSSTYTLPANPQAIRALQHPKSVFNLITTATPTPYAIYNLQILIQTMYASAKRSLILPIFVGQNIYFKAITVALNLYLKDKKPLKEVLNETQRYINDEFKSQ